MMNEQTVLFGPNQGMLGTIAFAENAGRERSDIGILMLNAGIVHRVGPHRINVRLARQLASIGIASIRFDLSGYGDSVRPNGEVSFDEQAVLDIRAAMDALANHAGVRHFAIFGFCSGAYFGYEAALKDERLAGILMFDAYRYPTVKTHIVRFLTRMRQPGAFSAIARALVNTASKRLTRRSLSHGESAPMTPVLGRVDFIPEREQFAQGLRELLKRGVNVRMIYSGGSIREYNYAGQFHDALAPFGIDQRVEVDFLPDLDHVASGLQDQAQLMSRVVDWAGKLS